MQDSSPWHRLGALTATYMQRCNILFRGMGQDRTLIVVLILFLQATATPLTPDELADAVGSYASPRTVRRYLDRFVRSGKVRRVRVGSRVRYAAAPALADTAKRYVRVLTPLARFIVESGDLLDDRQS